MPISKSVLNALAVVIALVAIQNPASAQAAAATNHTYSVSLMGGLGGSLDEDGPGFDNVTLQIGGSVVMEGNTRVGVRFGTMGFGTEQTLGRLFDADLSYATVSGEYGFGETGYQSAIFVGLGLYRLKGIDQPTGRSVDETNVGLTLGATGEFDITDRFGIMAELAGHSLASGEARFFASAMVGGVFSFK